MGLKSREANRWDQGARPRLRNGTKEHRQGQEKARNGTKAKEPRRSPAWRKPHYRGNNQQPTRKGVKQRKNGLVKDGAKTMTRMAKQTKKQN